MAKLLPVILALFGLAAGAGAGLALKPDAPAEAEAHSSKAQGATDAHAPPAAPAADGTHGASKPAEGHDFVKLNNQFVVPVVRDGRMSALVVMSLSLEVDAGGKAPVYAREPKLRDAFLRAMFDHANAGGFDGAFTESGRMALLRTALMEVAETILGPMVHDVLIIDLVRQDA